MKASVYFFLSIFLLTGCTSAEISKPKQDEGPVSLITGETGGWSLSDFMARSGSQPTSLPVNAILWRASLDIAAVLPIADIDTFGGTIVTDWYSLPEKPNERINACRQTKPQGAYKLKVIFGPGNQLVNA